MEGKHSSHSKGINCQVHSNQMQNPNTSLQTGTLKNRPIRLTQCCTQFKSLGVKILCVLNLHDNEAFTFE